MEQAVSPPLTAVRLPRVYSLGTTLVVSTMLVLATGSALLFFELTGRERDQLSRAKSAAAAMVADLVAPSLSAPLDFSDAESARSELENVRTNPEVVAVS